MNIGIKIGMDFSEQIIKTTIIFQEIQIVIIGETLIDKVQNANIVNSPGIS